MVVVSRASRANWASLGKQGSSILTGLRLHQRIDTSFHPRKVSVIGRFGHERNRRDSRNFRSCSTQQGTEGHSSNRTKGLSPPLSISDPKSLFAFKKSRVRVVESGHQGMRKRMRQVLDVQLAKRRDQRLSAPYRILCETIGLKLVLAGEIVAYRAEPVSEESETEGQGDDHRSK
jgi:hypothetical protein